MRLSELRRIIRESLGNKLIVNLFDFDDTLLHTPPAPKGRRFNWHVDPESLRETSQIKLIQAVADAYKTSQGRGEYTAVLTNRQNVPGLGEEIGKVMLANGLTPENLHLRNPGKDREKGPRAVAIVKDLGGSDAVGAVNFYDDDEKQLESVKNSMLEELPEIRLNLYRVVGDSYSIYFTSDQSTS